MKYIDKPKRYEKEDYIITAIILNIFHKKPKFFSKTILWQLHETNFVAMKYLKNI
jgi:hypothetical protein